jgi:hypothetical protein
MRDEQVLLQLIASPNTGSLDMRFYDLRLGILNDTVALLMVYLQQGIGARNWSEELERGIGARNWSEELERGIGARNWSEELAARNLPWYNRNVELRFFNLHGI